MQAGDGIKNHQINGVVPDVRPEFHLERRALNSEFALVVELLLDQHDVLSGVRKQSAVESPHELVYVGLLVANAVDHDGRTAIDFGVYGAPETFFIDANGRVQYRHVGAMTAEVWEREFLSRVPRGGLP